MTTVASVHSVAIAPPAAGSSALAPSPFTAVLLADGHPLFRAGLCALLQREPDLRIVAEVGRGEDVLAHARRSRPAVAVLDAQLPGLDGLTAALQIRQAVPQTAVLILAASARAADLRRALAAGVLGFLRKDATPAALVGAIRDIHAGRRAIDPLFERATWPDHETPTARELTVLTLLAEGRTNKEVALELALSVGTVRNYVSTVMAKIQARNRIDAVRICRERGWI